MRTKKDIRYDYIINILKGILATVVIDDFTDDDNKDYLTGLQRMKNDILTYSICQVLSELGCDPVKACLEAFGKVYNLIQHKARGDKTSDFIAMPDEFRKAVSKIDTNPAPVDRLVKLYNNNFKELYTDSEE